MNAAQWIDIVLSLSAGTCFILFIRLYLKSRSILELYFALAAFILGLPYLLNLFQVGASELFSEWYKLIAIITYISGLLVLIRESKPIFARFPIYLTALPFISLFFFPLIIDSAIIKNLLNAIYQGGALVVTALVFMLNHANKKGRLFYLTGIGMAMIAYLSYWFYLFKIQSQFIWISELLLSAGIILTTYIYVNQKTEEVLARLNER